MAHTHTKPMAIGAEMVCWLKKPLTNADKLICKQPKIAEARPVPAANSFIAKLLAGAITPPNKNEIATIGITKETTPPIGSSNNINTPPTNISSMETRKITGAVYRLSSLDTIKKPRLIMPALAAKNSENAKADQPKVWMNKPGANVT